jgi:hypothetical protein
VSVSLGTIIMYLIAVDRGRAAVDAQGVPVGLVVADPSRESVAVRDLVGVGMRPSYTRSLPVS